MTTTPTTTRLLDNYVGGSWTPSSSREALPVTNPATGETLARVPLSSADDLDAAVRAAREALPVWRGVSVIERGRRLFALREALDARREELARSVTTEMGKTLGDARAEVARMIEMVEAACAIPTTMQGRILEDVSRNVDAVSFVGSAPVARLVYERAAKAGKRVQALGGAKNHMVVMPDAVIDKTVAGIVGSAFGAAGQRCMAGSVVVTVGDAHDHLMGPLGEAAAALRVGDGIDEATELGPVVSERARERIVAAIERAVEDGARLAVDGRDPGVQGGASFLGATVLDEVGPDTEAVREEIFGPVLSVIRAGSLDEAIEIVGRSRFGNGVSIFTENGASVRRFRHEVEAGMVGVNIGVAAPVAFFPFSGWKDSFLGDLHAHGTDP